MRCGLLIALGISAAAALGLAHGARAQNAPPQIGFRGCIYYEHSSWQGRWRSIPVGTRRKFVGDTWNEIISSFACHPACHVVAFQDRDFQGSRSEFATTWYVGDPWNDRISSLIVSCRHL